jgi:inorganic phosphate transporter, PiT family
VDDLTLVAVVIVALFFDFTNGFHDTANAIATSVSTRALTPRTAVLLAAILNFAGAFASFAVAATIAKGIVNPDAITLNVILAGLVGAITWNLITWFLGLPSSSSHALIGGVAGSAIAASGLDVINWDGIWDKVVIPGVLSPVVGFAAALTLMLVIVWVIRRRSPTRVNRVFRRAQIVSGSFVAFTHGTNDAQKTMGIIALALVVSGHLDEDFSRPPSWVIVSSALAMAIGTYAGGWRIIRTMGTRIAKIDPPQGFAAQTACAGILWTTAHYGFPVSTTQTITGCVMGAGSIRGLSAVRWPIAGNIAVAWVLTLPAAGVVGAMMEVVTRLPAGDLIVFLLAGAIAAAAFTARRYETRRLVPAHA